MCLLSQDFVKSGTRSGAKVREEFPSPAYRGYAVPIIRVRTIIGHRQWRMHEHENGHHAGRFRSLCQWCPVGSIRGPQKNSPVHWNIEDSPNHGFWSVTRYRDIVEVLRDTQNFSSEIGAVNLEELDERQMEIRRSMLETDGDRHRALRKLLQPQFTPRALAGYETFLRGITATTLDRALVKDQFDFVAEVAADFPIRVLAQLLDVPDSDIPQLIKWGNRMIGNTDPEHADVLANSKESDKYKDLPFRSPAALEVFNYGFQLAEERRGGDGTDLVSSLINQVPSDGIELDDRDFRNYFLLLVIAGNETTRHTITHTMNNLMANPDQLEILRERPELIPGRLRSSCAWPAPCITSGVRPAKQ